MGRVSRLVEEFSRFIDMNIVLRQKASCQSLTRRKLGINISIDALRIPYPHMPWVGALELEGPRWKDLFSAPEKCMKVGSGGRKKGRTFIHISERKIRSGIKSQDFM